MCRTQEHFGAPLPCPGDMGQSRELCDYTPMGLWATFPLPAAGKGISAERLRFIVRRIDWVGEIQKDFDFHKLGLGLLKLHPWSAGFEALKPQQEISCIRNFPLLHMHLSSKHLMQGSCGIFPSALFKCILGFSISLFYWQTLHKATAFPRAPAACPCD